MMAVALPRPARRSTRCSSSTGIAAIAERRTQKLSGGETPARPVRRSRWSATPTCSCSTSRRWRWTSRAGTAFWATMRAFAARRQDGRVRDALPRGGGRLRRPRRADGPRADRRRRPDHRDQGAWSARARSARRCPVPIWGELERLPGVTGRERHGEAVVLTLLRLRRGDPRAARRLRRRARHRDHAAPAWKRRSWSSPARRRDGGRA